jgi:hypothetical protein
VVIGDSTMRFFTCMDPIDIGDKSFTALPSPSFNLD